jgi:hypothetical protein
MDRFGKNDVYAKINVHGDERKTSIIDEGGEAPVWGEAGAGEAFSFELREPPQLMSVQIYDHDNASADDLIGEHPALS